MKATKHYVALDGMRGVAALCVVVLHAQSLLGGKPLPSAYLAVDFFFALSGFVIAHAYQRRFDSGLSVGEFFYLRIIRLAPLYVLACGLALGVQLLKVAASKTTPLDVLTQLPNILLVPSSPAARQAIYPLNYVAWSLALEIVANLVFAFGQRGLKHNGVLAAVVSAGAAFLVWAAFRFGHLDIGVIWDDAIGGLARVSFSFFLGIGLYRLHVRHPFSLPPLLTPVLLGCLLLIFLAAPAGGHPRIVYDLFTTLALCPLLVFLGSAATETRRQKPLLRFMGDTSYAIYVLHLPLRELFLSGFRHMNLQPSILIGGLFISTVVLIAFAADRWFDTPLRKRLKVRAAAAHRVKVN